MLLHHMMTIPYFLWFHKFYLVDTNKLPPGTVFVLHTQLTSYIQIDLGTLNHSQIIAIICRNADGRVCVEHQLLVN